MLDLHNKYGPVVRIGPTDLSFNTPQAFQDIYGSRPGKGLFSKDPKIWASKLNALRDSIVGQVDHDAHARHRRLLSHAFSDRYLREQEGIVLSFVDLLISRLRERISEDGLSKEDIKNWMNFVTFDITGDLMFAETFDCLKNSQLHPWISFLFTTIKGALFLSVMNRFALFSRMNQLLLPEYLREQMMKNTSLSREKADRRLKKETSRPDFMAALLKHGLGDEKGQFTENQSIMSLTEIHANSMLITLAGSETSASLLSGCIFLLCKNATAMADLRSEVRTAFSEDKEITPRQCARLKYLNAVIEESLRVYPPLVTSLLRIAPTGGEFVDGHFVPEHANVSTHHYASYHSPANFALPDEFIPERWLGVDGSFRAIADHKKFRLGITEIIWDDARLSRGPRKHNGFPGGESDISDEETEESFLAKHRAGQDWAPDWRVEWNFHDSDSESDDDDNENDDEDTDDDDDDLDVVRKSENFRKQNCPLWFKAACLESLDDHFWRQGPRDFVDYGDPCVKSYKDLSRLGLPLGKCWDFYRKLVRQQDDVLTGKYDEEAFLYGLERFPALKKVTVTPAAHGVLFRPLYQTPMIRQFPPGFYYPVPRGWPLPCREQPEEVYCHPWQSLSEKYKEKYHGFRIVTRTLAHQKHSVTDLNLDACELRTGINCMIFDDPCEEYDNLSTILKRPGFRQLKLALAIRGIEEPGQNWRSLSNERLHQALGEASSLEKISLCTAGIVSYGEAKEAPDYAPVVPLESIFPFDKWPKLRHFELSRFFVKQSDILSCLSRLPDTLESVKLSFLVFVDNGKNGDDWHPFLTEMRKQIREKVLWPGRQPNVTIGCMRSERIPGRARWLGKEINAFLYGEGENPFLEPPKGLSRMGFGQDQDSLDPNDKCERL
ncbi:hypothetical protein N7466_009780 [Penicillium verhagenii]|uniref:uncharacterized protein n=1 Tax=Penicillium verhagenii TaxID=1562060 RepID=UPI002545BC76|nr:uncharacterized protein N7466_009780 [Penicillium verhagenii]KAJ5921454.1 hypothetical protein N7466_009780 [Penicillium verhagenii]